MTGFREDFSTEVWVHAFRPARSLAMVQTRHQLNANESSAEVGDAQKNVLVFGYVLGTCRFGKHQFPEVHPGGADRTWKQL